MRVDSRELAPDAELQADVAVVGAGPTGIVVALELAEHGHRVVLVESGGESSADIQPPAELILDDPFHVPLSLATCHQVGGASNLWGGRCVPFDPIDFEPREIVGDARWPVSYGEVAQHFSRACQWAVCGDALFDADDVPGLADASLVPGLVNTNVRSTSLERWSLPTNFGRVYRDALRHSANVTLVTNLTCVGIASAENGSVVRQLEARTPDGRCVTVRASKYVLTCGGLENTRLLFASNAVHRDGIGNHSGHLGRWYMGHVESRMSEIHFVTPQEATIYGYERDPSGVYVRRRFTFAPDFLVREELANCAMWLINPAIADPAHRSGVLSFVYLALASPLGSHFVAEGIRQYHIGATKPVCHRTHLRNLAREIIPAMAFALKFGYQRYLKRGRKVPGFFVRSASNVYPLDYHGEHLPNRDSYVAPTPERDSFGMPRLRTHLQLGDADVASAIRAHHLLDQYLRYNRVGHLEYMYDDAASTVRNQFFGGYHQAGTTRMSARPEDGVVDRNLAVHGFEDLFIASSSAFVTSSQANPMLTILAFALRLVDHLRGELAAGR